MADAPRPREPREPFDADPARDPDAGPVDRHVFVVHHLVPGVVATALITLGSLGVGWLPLNTGLYDDTLIRVLHETDLGKLVARALVIIGGALLLQTWLVLGVDVLSGRLRDVRRMWVLLAAWCAPLMISIPLFSRDVYSYFAQGKLVAAGFDPYNSSGVSSVPGWAADGVDPLWAETPTPYGPFFLMISRGIATFVGPNPVMAALMFRIVAAIGVALLAYYLPRLAFLHGIDPTKALWLGVLNPLVLMHFIAGVHNDALMVGLIVMGLALAAERRPVLGLLVLGLAASVKPIALLAVPFAGLLWAGTRAGWWRRIATWAGSAAISLGTIVVLGAMIGVGFGWLNALSTPGVVRTWLSPSTALGMTIGGIGGLLGRPEILDGAVTVVRLIAMAAALAFVAWLCLKPEGRTPVRGAALAFAAVVVLGPVVQVWYLLWALPLVAATGLKRSWHLRAIILGTAAFVIYGLAESSATADSFIELQDGLAVLVAIAAVAVVLLASPRERELVMGDQYAEGLTPDDAPALARSRQLVVVGPPGRAGGPSPGP